MPLATRRTRLVDLGGATVIPGLADSHDHLWNSAKYLYRGVGVFNNSALRRLGVSRLSPVFNGVKVPVDKDGEPLGTSPGYPTGVYMIDALLPTLTVQQQNAMVTSAMAQRNALGITSIRELALWPEAVKALQRMRREGRLTVRMALGVEFPDQGRTAEHLAGLPPLRRGDPWLFLDAVGEEPWTPGSTHLNEFTQLVRDENRLGWRPAPHVGADLLRGISADDATDQTLAAYEAVDRESPLNGKRWYLERAPFATPEQMDRMAKLGLVISTQDAGYKPAADAPLPRERLEHYNPIRGFLDHNLVVIGGSDYSGPTAAEKDPNNPLIPFYFYVTRKSLSGEIKTPAEKISREQALRIFTTGVAYATFQEKIKGQIAPEMLATFVGGRKVYSAPAAAQRTAVSSP